MTDHERITARTLGGRAVLDVGLDAGLVPPYGPVGTALATSPTVVRWHLLGFAGWRFQR